MSGGDRATSVGEITHEIARSNLSTFLTPSSIAAELRPDLDPREAADIYTGRLRCCNSMAPVQFRVIRLLSAVTCSGCTHAP